MAPLFEIKVDQAAFDAALREFPEQLTRAINEVASDTADRIVADAKARVARRTGLTAAGIHKEPSHTGLGYVVLAERDPFPNLPAWLEHGTSPATRGKHKGGSGMRARPFFDPSVQLEAPGHERRLREAIVDVIDEMGLGD